MELQSKPPVQVHDMLHDVTASIAHAAGLPEPLHCSCLSLCDFHLVLLATSLVVA